MHYEIEQAGVGDKHRPDVGTHAEPARWHAVNVFDADVVPTPLTFDTIDHALAYVAPTSGTLRIVEVIDEGERVLVNRSTSRGVSRKPPRTTRSSCASRPR